MTKLQEQMSLLLKMELPDTRVAYYGCLLVAIVTEFAFHVCAVAGKNWIEAEPGDNKFTEGLWVTCGNGICVKLDEIYLILSGKFVAVRAFMIIATLTSAYSGLMLLLAVAMPKKIIFRLLTLSFLMTVVSDIIAMTCYTDYGKNKPTPASFGWSYYMGWVAMGFSFAIGLFSLLNEFLPPLEQMPNHNDVPVNDDGQQHHQLKAP